MLKFTAHPDRIIPSGHAVVRDGFENVTDIVTDVTDIVTDNLTDKESLVLKLIIENNFYTTSEMATKLAVSRQTIARSLKALQEKKLIRRIGSDRKGQWEVISANVVP